MGAGSSAPQPDPELAERLRRAEEAVEALSRRLKDADARGSSVEAELAALRRQRDEDERRLREAEASAKGADGRARVAEEAKSAAERTLRALEEERDGSVAAVSALERAVAELQAQVQTLRSSGTQARSDRSASVVSSDVGTSRSDSARVESPARILSSSSSLRGISAMPLPDPRPPSAERGSSTAVVLARPPTTPSVVALPAHVPEDVTLRPVLPPIGTAASATHRPPAATSAVDDALPSVRHGSLSRLSMKRDAPSPLPPRASSAMGYVRTGGTSEGPSARPSGLEQLRGAPRVSSPQHQVRGSSHAVLPPIAHGAGSGAAGSTGSLPTGTARLPVIGQRASAAAAGGGVYADDFEAEGAGEGTDEQGDSRDNALLSHGAGEQASGEGALEARSGEVAADDEWEDGAMAVDGLAEGGLDFGAEDEGPRDPDGHVDNADEGASSVDLAATLGECSEVLRRSESADSLDDELEGAQDDGFLADAERTIERAETLTAAADVDLPDASALSAVGSESSLAFAVATATADATIGDAVHAADAVGKIIGAADAYLALSARTGGAAEGAHAAAHGASRGSLSDAPGSIDNLLATAELVAAGHPGPRGASHAESSLVRDDSGEDARLLSSDSNESSRAGSETSLADGSTLGDRVADLIAAIDLDIEDEQVEATSAPADVLQRRLQRRSTSMSLSALNAASEAAEGAEQTGGVGVTAVPTASVPYECHVPYGKGRVPPMYSSLPRRDPQTGWVTLYAFISSCFADMHGERDVLTRFVFPRLNEMCASRRVQVIPVDLRWGVRLESEVNTSALVCLNEIDKSTFFIGIVGERYGWCPPAVPNCYNLPTNDERFWFAESAFTGRSITHLEMFYGALQHPSLDPPLSEGAEHAPRRAFFYLRDPAFMQRDDFRKLRDTEETRRVYDDFQCASGHEPLLAELKDAIAALPGIPATPYTCSWRGIVDMKPMVGDLDAFAESVIANLWGSIATMFPKSEIGAAAEGVDQHDIVRAAHDRRVRELLVHSVERPQAVDAVVSYFARAPDEASPPLMLIGESGAGKSTVMAAVANRLLNDASVRTGGDWGAPFTHVHFVGAGPESTSVDLLLRRFLRERARLLGDAADALADDDACDFRDLCAAFADALAAMSGRRVPVHLLIDAVDQLDELFDASSLDWLPSVLPAGVRVAVSTVVGHASQLSGVRMGLPTQHLGLLTPAEREEIVTAMLGVQRKTLSAPQMRAIVEKESSGLPLYLKIACQELALYGHYDSFDSAIAGMPATVAKLLVGVIVRWETDHGAALVKDALCLLVCVRAGLLESEALAILACSPGAWSKFLVDLRAYLRPIEEAGTRGEGRLDLFHRQLAVAIRERYRDYGTYHQRLARYFSERLEIEMRSYSGGVFPRAQRELPYHQRVAGMYVEALVVTRVRNFDEKERAANEISIVRMHGNKTIVKNPDTGRDDEFSFHYSFWSHDRKGGSNAPYISQENVHAILGQDAIQNAFDGVNVCLFAYGQTGSGKTYTMYGTPDDRGLVPRILEELYRRVEASAGKEWTYEMDFMMFEIYNGKVQDLLGVQHGEKRQLFIREVNGVLEISNGDVRTITSHAHLRELLQQGRSHCTVAATEYNATSSRAHTILQVRLHRRHRDKSEARRTNKLFLVDLAGSERLNVMPAEGRVNAEEVAARQLESRKINKSLTVLNSCISAIVEGKPVPYRDSKLTMVLKESLVGSNSRVVMVAAISPRMSNYAETMSTLRYADIAKSLKSRVAAAPTEKPELFTCLQAFGDAENPVRIWPNFPPHKCPTVCLCQAVAPSLSLCRGEDGASDSWLLVQRMDRGHCVAAQGGRSRFAFNSCIALSTITCPRGGIIRVDASDDWIEAYYSNYVRHFRYQEDLNVRFHCATVQREAMLARALKMQEKLAAEEAKLDQKLAEDQAAIDRSLADRSRRFAADTATNAAQMQQAAANLASALGLLEGEVEEAKRLLDANKISKRKMEDVVAKAKQQHAKLKKKHEARMKELRQAKENIARTFEDFKWTVPRQVMALQQWAAGRRAEVELKREDIVKLRADAELTALYASRSLDEWKKLNVTGPAHQQRQLYTPAEPQGKDQYLAAFVARVSRTLAEERERALSAPAVENDQAARALARAHLRVSLGERVAGKIRAAPGRVCLVTQAGDPAAQEAQYMSLLTPLASSGVESEGILTHAIRRIFEPADGSVRGVPEVTVSALNLAKAAVADDDDSPVVSAGASGVTDLLDALRFASAAPPVERQAGSTDGAPTGPVASVATVTKPSQLVGILAAILQATRPSSSKACLAAFAGTSSDPAGLARVTGVNVASKAAPLAAVASAEGVSSSVIWITAAWTDPETSVVTESRLVIVDACPLYTVNDSGSVKSLLYTRAWVVRKFLGVDVGKVDQSKTGVALWHRDLSLTLVLEDLLGRDLGKRDMLAVLGTLVVTSNGGPSAVKTYINEATLNFTDFTEPM